MTDPTTPLTAESEALLAEVHGTQMALTVFPARLRAIEDAAARRAIEGSGMVEALRGLVVSWSAKAASLRLTRSERHIGQAIGFANAAFDLDQALAALPRPEEPRVERCAFVWESDSCGKPERHFRHKHDSSCSSGEGHITDMICHPFTSEAR